MHTYADAIHHLLEELLATGLLRGARGRAAPTFALVIETDYDAELVADAVALFAVLGFFLFFFFAAASFLLDG